ncbi:MAG: ATP-binding protein [Gammaproteobacteria bacterium]|nr:ATP-binding protein [Gammaproteobacteria bacterium]
MKLRSQILIFLLFFGTTPLLVAISINAPLMFNQLEMLYHKAYLQSLRDDFRDVEQHLATRHEMVRLLTKFPEPGIQLKHTPPPKGFQIDLVKERIRYTDWLNHILKDQQDITQVLFLDPMAAIQFCLERDPQTLNFSACQQTDTPVNTRLFQTSLNSPAGVVLVGAIRFNPAAGRVNPRHFMNLSLISPISTDANTSPLGAVVVHLDIGGLAKAYQDTYWVYNNGSYLKYGEAVNDNAQAFTDYPGLKELFSKGTFALWKQADQAQVIWVPLFATEKNGPLWVGRRVDPSPMETFSNRLENRTLLVMAILFVLVLLIAHWIAKRLSTFGRELLTGISQVLKGDGEVRFQWRGSQEVKQLSNELSQLSKSHSQHSQKLRHHAKELEESNRYKSEFLANVSHELRTPLNSILLLSKLLSQQDTLNAESRQQAQVIHNAGSDLKSLIDNILDLSQIEARKCNIHLKPVDLVPLLHELLELLQPQFAAKHLSLSLHIEPLAQTQITSDREKLRQIIKNFLSNAVKFTQQGGVEIRLLDHSAADRQHPIQISVHDSGIGIAKEKQQLIFEAFRQADGSTNRRFGGTGLGLSISRELAHLLGAEIHLESQANHGSIFSLHLPLEVDTDRIDEQHVIITHQENAASPAPHASHSIAPPLLEANFKQQRLLLVENDLNVLLSLTPLLESWNLHVTAAGDGQEALETLQDEPDFDLILLDMNMPKRDGFETLKSLRQQTRFQKLTVISLIKRDQNTDQIRCLAIGATDSLNKPLEHPALLKTLNQYLSPSLGESP